MGMLKYLENSSNDPKYDWKDLNQEWASIPTSIYSNEHLTHTAYEFWFEQFRSVLAAGLSGVSV